MRINNMKAGRIKEQGEARKPMNIWTEKELEQLEQGLKLHGKDVLKLREHLPNKSNKEIIRKFQTVKEGLKKDNKVENLELVEILTKGEEKFWTKDEHLSFEQAVTKFGVDKDQIHKMVPSRTLTQIQSRLNNIRRSYLKVDHKFFEIIQSQT